MPSTGEYAAWYREMLRIRLFEETMYEKSTEGLVPGPLHLSVGQEGVAVGACAKLRESDAILSSHRGHHHLIGKGARLDRMMAELLGRSDGYSRGRGGSMHVAVPDLGIIGTNGIVGGGIPIAVGVGYGFQIQDRDDVVVCFFGEGASSTGAFGEALNLASLWKLPVIFICENNQYVELTPASIHIAGQVFRRAEGYDMPGFSVDGNDVAEVARVVDEAVARARAGDGPTLIEAETYRWYGHYAADKALYRPEGELERWRSERDPIANTLKHLTASVADEINMLVNDEIAAALEFALSSPPADESCIHLDHYEA